MADAETAKRQGFSASMELDALEPLVSWIQRLHYHAELRVRTDGGGVGQLQYVDGELIAGVFDGASGALALERLLALRSGAVELQVSSRQAAPPEPTPAGPALPQHALPRPALPAPAASSLARPEPLPRVEATTAFGESAPLRSWLWALAPGAALALWFAAELAEHLSRRSPGNGPIEPAAAASAAPRPSSVPRD